MVSNRSQEAFIPVLFTKGGEKAEVWTEMVMLNWWHKEGLLQLSSVLGQTSALVTGVLPVMKVLARDSMFLPHLMPEDNF